MSKLPTKKLDLGQKKDFFRQKHWLVTQNRVTLHAKCYASCSKGLGMYGYCSVSIARIVQQNELFNRLKK